MSKLDIVRAWKDESYRNSLSATELARLPANPAGLVEYVVAGHTGSPLTRDCAADPEFTAGFRMRAGYQGGPLTRDCVVDPEFTAGFRLAA